MGGNLPVKTGMRSTLVSLITAVGVMKLSSAARLKLPASATRINVSSYGLYIFVSPFRFGFVFALLYPLFLLHFSASIASTSMSAHRAFSGRATSME